jgi:hypothetical protein
VYPQSFGSAPLEMARVTLLSRVTFVGRCQLLRPTDTDCMGLSRSRHPQQQRVTELDTSSPFASSGCIVTGASVTKVHLQQEATN